MIDRYVTMENILRKPSGTNPKKKVVNETLVTCFWRHVKRLWWGKQRWTHSDLEPGILTEQRSRCQDAIGGQRALPGKPYYFLVSEPLFQNL